MTMRLSRLYNMPMVSDSGKSMGHVVEIIVDKETGVVSRLLREQLPKSPVEAKKVIEEHSIKYENVLSVGEDAIVIKGRRDAA